MLSESDSVRCILCLLYFPAKLLSKLPNQLISRHFNCVGSHGKHWLLAANRANLISDVGTMTLPNYFIEHFGSAYFYMVWHRLLLWGLVLESVLEDVRLIGTHAALPVDRLETQIA